VRTDRPRPKLAEKTTPVPGRNNWG